jgi:hypothetical protein
VRRCGGSTKRFAGVTFLDSASILSQTAAVGLGVGNVKVLRRLVGGFCLAAGAAGGFVARKRCGDGVCVGIVSPLSDPV